MMRRILVAGVLLLAAWPTLAQQTPVGLWRNVDDKTGVARAEIRISAKADGTLSGVIEKALVKSDHPNCDECTDDRKGQPKLGMEIIRGARKAPDEDAWVDGSILDPDNGRSYRLRLTPLDGGSRLQVRGYFGPFFRTQVWSRLQ